MSGPAEPIVLLSGGTGGAKLARGMLEAFGPDRLTVIANTGDDIEIYGALVSPDPDLVSFWLAGADRRARLGPARRHLRRDGRAAGPRREGVVQPRRPRPGVVRAPLGAHDGRGDTDPGARGTERVDLPARACAADERRPRSYLGLDPRRGLVLLPGVHDPDARAGTRRRDRVPRRGGRRTRARRCSRRSRAPGRS